MQCNSHENRISRFAAQTYKRIIKNQFGGRFRANKGWPGGFFVCPDLTRICTAERSTYDPKHTPHNRKIFNARGVDREGLKINLENVSIFASSRAFCLILSLMVTRLHFNSSSRRSRLKRVAGKNLRSSTSHEIWDWNWCTKQL